MAEPIPLHKPRKGAFATPDKVFPACNELFEEMGWGFKISDVIAKIGGGSNTTLGPIVAMWRHYQPLFQATKTLDDTSAVEIAQAVDKLLAAKTKQVDEALKSFMNGAGAQIAEISTELEQYEIALNVARDEAESMRQRIRELETDKTRLTADLESKTRTLAERDSQLQLNAHELKNAHASHAAKLEQLASHHQHELMLALEAQRKAIEQEKRDALEQQENTLRQQNVRNLAEADNARAKVQASADRLQEELIAARDREHTIALVLKESQAENRAHEAQLARQEAIIEENRDSLAGAQQAQRDLIAAVKQQLASNTDDVETRLRSLVTATDSVTDALADVQQLLSEIQKSMADKPRPQG